MVLMVLLPLVLFIVNSNEGWHRGDVLWETSRYFHNILLLFWLAFSLAVAGFWARKAGYGKLLGPCLCVASLVTCLGMFDFFVLFRTETTGPGGNLCLTHKNWYERVAKSNSLGFWEREPSTVSPDAKVVAAVGDSFAFGQGLQRAEDRFTDRLDLLLGESIEVLNFSRGGASTRNQLDDLLPYVKKVKPDVVVLFYLTNDIHDSIGHPQPKPKIRSKWENRFLVGSPTWNYLYWKTFAAFSFEKEAGSSYNNLLANYQDADNFAEHVEDLQELVKQVNDMGAKPAVVILPYPHLWLNVSEQERESVLAKLTAAIPAPVLRLDELEKQFPVGEFEINSMDAHPSAEVHQAIAEKTEPWLKALLSPKP